MSELSANLITVEWGLLSVFGVVVGLLIAPTDRYLHQFLSSAAEEDRERANRWALCLRVTSWMVLLFLGFLTLLGMRDAGLGFTGRFTTNSWLLISPIVAQLGFVALVQELVRSVPPIAVVPLEQAAVLEKSPGGHRSSTVLRFVNNTSSEIYYQWVDFDGHLDERVSVKVPPASEVPQQTYAGHRFAIMLKKEEVLGTAVAVANPGKVVIEPMYLSTKGTTHLSISQPSPVSESGRLQ